MTDNLHTIFSESGCPAHDQLRAYQEGRLEENEKHSMEVHLADCEMCSDELEGLSLLSDPDRIPAIVDELEQRITTGKIRRFHLSTRMILASAAVIVLLIGATFVFRYIIQDQAVPLLSEQQTTDDSQVVIEIPLPPVEEATVSDSKTKEVIRETPSVAGEQNKSVSVISTPAQIPAETKPEIQETAPSAGKEGKAQMTRAESEATEATELGGITKDSGTKKKLYIDGVKTTFSASRKGTNLAGKETNLMTDALDLYSEEKFPDAAKLFQQVITKDPENYEAMYHLAICYFEMAQKKKALKTLEKILETPDNEYYQLALDLKEKW